MRSARRKPPNSWRSNQLAEHPLRLQAIQQGVDLDRLPHHVAIIMDGNGRWAESQGLERGQGHHQGYLRLRDILLDADSLGIEVLTVYGFSVENWRRPEEEVGGLMSLIHEAARQELRLLVSENVQVHVAGRKEGLPDWLRESLDAMVEETKHATGIKFCLALNYGGRAEIVDAVRACMADGLEPEEVSEESISARLYCPSLPEPDLIIRTAGEMRWSNFLIWQAAYAELHVTPSTWPDFTADELIQAVLAYQSRTRKFGGLSAEA